MIGDQGAIAIARGLETNNILEIIKMGNNQISDKGGLELAERLLKNSMLKKLVLDHNPISDSTVIELRKLEQKIPKISVKLEGLFSK